jgi:ankyrin repeat protein
LQSALCYGIAKASGCFYHDIFHPQWFQLFLSLRDANTVLLFHDSWWQSNVKQTAHIVINFLCLHLRIINMSQMRQIEKDLLNASYNGDLEKAKRAIENGADVNAKCQDLVDPIDWTPRHPLE